MRELRVYINPAGTSTPDEQSVFYSRRAGGPYYRWLFEVELGQWCCSRVHLPNLTLKTLCAASWRIVPSALQAKLNEHYPE
jgi:hypothetical protein